MSLNLKSNIPDFGIILTCYKGDYFLTKGLLASINQFLPHVPICIIQDGDFAIESELSFYNITNVIRKADVKNDFLRETSFGTRCTNMIAFWESPFHHFLYIDSDTIFWGNILKQVEIEKYDFISNSPHEPYTEYILHSQYFDYQRLFEFVPEINVVTNHFFNAGVFFATKGIFELEEYKKLYLLYKKDHSLFGPEPQGFINYLVFSGVEQGKIKQHEISIQKVVPVFSVKELEDLYSCDSSISNVTENTIIHWAGLKPNLTNSRNVFNKPMRFFRKQNLLNINSKWKYYPFNYYY